MLIPFSMRCALSWILTGLILAAFCWLFPPFHIVPLQQARKQQQAAAFDAAAFAATFWEKQLLPATSTAASATEVLSLLTKDPHAARKRFGRSPGLSSAVYFFVKESGQITSIEKHSIRIALDGPEPKTQVGLSTGLLFGNTVRDACGLLNVSDFPNSQDFNDLSSELNRLVETRILPDLRQHAAVGKSIRFTGCIELAEGPPPKVVEIVPVKVEWP